MNTNAHAVIINPGGVRGALFGFQLICWSFSAVDPLSPPPAECPSQEKGAAFRYLCRWSEGQPSSQRGCDGNSGPAVMRCTPAKIHIASIGLKSLKEVFKGLPFAAPWRTAAWSIIHFLAVHPYVEYEDLFLHNVTGAAVALELERVHLWYNPQLLQSVWANVLWARGKFVH